MHVSKSLAIASLGALLITWGVGCGANGSQAPDLADAVEIASGYHHICARSRDGSVRCWGGGNEDGQIGDNTTKSKAVPTPVVDLTDAVEIGVGNGHSCARLDNGRVKCWGLNHAGQIGDGFTMIRLVPTLVVELEDAVGIAVGGVHSCARLKAGTVKCWGNNQYGQLADGTTENRSKPTLVPGLDGVQEIAAGRYHTCARLHDGSVKCWGGGSSGQIGDGTSGTAADKLTPTAVAGLTDSIEIGLGEHHSCARVQDGEIKCWGSNWEGQLGDGSKGSTSTTFTTVEWP